MILPGMRRSLALALIAAVALILGIAALVVLGPKDRDRRPPPSAAQTARASAPPRAPAPPFDGERAEVLPLHQAVRRATRRFHGKPLDITLTAPRPDERAAGVVLVYQLRMLTRSRDVLDIRMDALSGDFLELRGADLSNVRRGKDD